MFAEFLHKRRFYKLLCCLPLILSLCCVVYAYSFLSIKSVQIDGCFYFLVSDDARVAAGSEFVKWQGGAGYLLENEGEDYVAINVFLNKQSAEVVQKRLSSNGQKTLLIEKGAEKLYFKGEQKKKRELYVEALNLFKSYLSLLEECITRLENGITQEVCKCILRTIERQFSYVHQQYSEYPSFQEVCKSSSKKLANLCKNTVYLKDLRHLLCWQTEKYIQLCKVYAL